MEDDQRHHRMQPVLAVAAMSSGIALVASVLTGFALGPTLVLLGTASVLLVAHRWHHLQGAARARLRAQVLTGLVGGFAATIAYDISRLFVAWAGRLELTPYETWGIFGELIVGSGPGSSVQFAVGTVYHLLNGVAFAVAYCFLFGGRRWTWGVAWGLGLEAAMLAIYPGWLDLDAVIVEFTSMSLIGHIAYGSVLGVISQRRLGSTRSPDRVDVGAAWPG